MEKEYFLVLRCVIDGHIRPQGGVSDIRTMMSFLHSFLPPELSRKSSLIVDFFLRSFPPLKLSGKSSLIVC